MGFVNLFYSHGEIDMGKIDPITNAEINEVFEKVKKLLLLRKGIEVELKRMGRCYYLQIKGKDMGYYPNFAIFSHKRDFHEKLSILEGVLE